MTKHEKKIILLQAIGWREIPWEELTTPREAREKKLYCIDTARHLCLWTPDIFGNLDECRKAEMELITDKHTDTWVECLCDIVLPLGWSSAGRIRACEAALRATAEQRAEADNATPGPWRTWGTTVVAGPGIDVADAITVASTWQRSALGYPRTGDSNFIAASRTGWPKALRSLKTAIEGLLSVMPPCPTLEPSPLLRDHVAACLRPSAETPKFD